MPDKVPLISVIVPAYQCEEVLGRALDSALQQGYPELEIIVVDDGSTDHTRQVVEQYNSRDPRLLYFRQPNQGPAAARNCAVENASGEYLAFLDADDEWRPGKLRLQSDVLKQCACVDLVFSDSLEVNDETGSSRLFSEHHAQVMRTLETKSLADNAQAFAITGGLRLAVFRGGLIHLSSVMIRRSTFKELSGFDPRRRGTEDVDLLVRATQLARFAYCSQALAVHHQRAASISQPSEAWHKEIIRHLQMCLTSPDYADLQTEARRSLRLRYRMLIFYHGRHWQPSRAWAAFRGSLGAGFDWVSALCALAAWLGPLPFMASGRLLWP